jgi:hypothetical protein
VGASLRGAASGACRVGLVGLGGEGDVATHGGRGAAGRWRTLGAAALVAVAGALSMALPPVAAQTTGPATAAVAGTPAAATATAPVLAVPTVTTTPAPAVTLRRVTEAPSAPRPVEPGRAAAQAEAATGCTYSGPTYDGYFCAPSDTISLSSTSTAGGCTWTGVFTWGDGASDTQTLTTGTVLFLHSYAGPGVYTARLSWTGVPSGPTPASGCSPGAYTFIIEVPVTPTATITPTATATSTATPTATAPPACPAGARGCVAPDLTVALGAAPASAIAGEPMTITLRVTALTAGGEPGGSRAVRLPGGTVLLRYAVPPGVRYTAVDAPRGYGCTDPAPRVTVVECTATRPDALPTGQDLTFTLTLLHAPAFDVEPSLTHRVVVDPTNAVAERDEANNAAAQTVAVAAPDLRVWMFDSPPLLPYGASYPFPVHVYNAGTVPSRIPTGTVLLQMAPLVGLYVESATVSVPGIECSLTNNLQQVTVTGYPSGDSTVYTVSRGSADCTTTQPLVIAPGQEVVFQFATRIAATPNGIFSAYARVDPLRVLFERSRTALPPTPDPPDADGRLYGDNLTWDRGGFADFG